MATHSEQDLKLVGLSLQECQGYTSRKNLGLVNPQRHYKHKETNNRGRQEKKIEPAGGSGGSGNTNSVDDDLSGIAGDDFECSQVLGKRPQGSQGTAISSEQGGNRNESIINYEAPGLINSKHNGRISPSTKTQLAQILSDEMGRPVAKLNWYHLQIFKIKNSQVGQLQEEVIAHMAERAKEFTSIGSRVHSVIFQNCYSLVTLDDGVLNNIQTIFEQYKKTEKAMMATALFGCGLLPNRLFITHEMGEFIAFTQVFDTNVKRIADSEGVLLFMKQRSLLEILLSKLRELHKNWFYHQNINMWNILFSESPSRVYLTQWYDFETWHYTEGNNVSVAIGFWISRSVFGPMFDVLGILWTLADLCFVQETDTLERPSLRYPSQMLCRDDQIDLLHWGESGGTSSMGVWTGFSSRQHYTFGQLLIKIAQSMRASTDVSEYMTGALKFLEDKEDKTIIPFEDSRAATPKKRVQIILDSSVEIVDSESSVEKQKRKQKHKRSDQKKQ